MIEEEGRLYFCTNHTKSVYQQIKHQSYVEICTSSPQFGWIRLSGKALFSQDLSIKEKVIESSSLVKSLYQSASNPIFEIFYLEEAHAVMADFSGNPPREYIL